MKSDFEIAQQFKKHHTSSLSLLSAQYDAAGQAQAFYAGDLMDYKDNVQFSDPSGAKKRAMVQFNKVKPYVNAVKGFMAQNRRRAKYSARIIGDEEQKTYSQYSNSLADYLRDQANADQVETQQDGDMLIGGYGVVETAMTYGIGHATTDPNGQVLVGRIDPMDVFWDPKAKYTNLLDARWCGYKRIYGIDEAMDLFDDKWTDHFESADGADDEKENYRWYERGGRYNKIRETTVEWADKKEKNVKVYFYQWYEIETFYRCDNPVRTLRNPQSVAMAQAHLAQLAQTITPEQADVFSFDPTAEILTFDDTIKAEIQKAFGKFVEVYEYPRKVYYAAVISGQHVFTKYRSPYQQGFTLKFKTGDYDAKNKIWTGMVASMKDPVLYYNKALTELMFIIGANSKGGVLVEKSAVENIAEFEQRYAKTDSVIIVNDGALSGNKIQPKRQPYTPTGYENIIQLSDASISDVNGIDKAFLGSSENKQETGILQRRRIKQVQSSLACYFDAITLYQKEHARLMLDFMRIYAQNNDGSMFRVLGQNGRSQYMQISANGLAAQYDVEIIEAPQSEEEKQEYAQIITSIADKLLGVDPNSAKIIYGVALKYLSIDQEDMQKVLRILTPQQPQVDPQYVKQLEQQIQALMSEVTQADVEKKRSETALNRSKLDEVAAAVHQKLAQADREQQQAVKTNIEAAFMQQHPQQTQAVI